MSDPYRADFDVFGVEAYLCPLCESDADDCGTEISGSGPLTVRCTRPEDHPGEHAACGLTPEEHPITTQPQT